MISPKMETESLERELVELKALFKDCKLDERSPESKEKCLMLRNLVYKQIQKEFEAEEIKLFEMRIAAYKRQDWKTYDKCVKIRNKVRASLVQSKTNTLLQELDQPRDVYSRIFRAMLDDPDYRSKFEKFDNQLVLNKFEGKTIFETREEITAIWKDKLAKQAQGRVKIYREHPGEKAS